MINNISLIKSLLDFSNPDSFYHLQIIKRKKEHPELGSNSQIIKTYYISSSDYLDNKIEEIISLCNLHNARACINLNRRGFEKIAFQVLRKVTDQIMNKDFKSVRKAYESVCGAYSDEPNKKWIIDIDYTDNHDYFLIMKIIQELHDEANNGSSIIAHNIPTKNGFHIISNPFRLDRFRELYTVANLDIHKDNPTILYIP